MRRAGPVAVGVTAVGFGIAAAVSAAGDPAAVGSGPSYPTSAPTPPAGNRMLVCELVHPDEAGRAASEIQDLGWSALYRASYAGLAMCPTGSSRLVVYRLSNAAFDDAARLIAARYAVPLSLRQAGVSHARMEELAREVHRRKAQLEVQGARLTSIANLSSGEVEAHVLGDLAAARKILADLRHVTVVPGEESYPL